jgi:hypothetical protein
MMTNDINDIDDGDGELPHDPNVTHREEILMLNKGSAVRS